MPNGALTFHIKAWFSFSGAHQGGGNFGGNIRHVGLMLPMLAGVLSISSIVLLSTNEICSYAKTGHSPVFAFLARAFACAVLPRVLLLARVRPRCPSRRNAS